MTRASAPGKVILFGEHAVVYGRPAIAVPLPEIRACAEVTSPPGMEAGACVVVAPDVGVHARLDDLESNHPLRRIISDTLRALAIDRWPPLEVHVTSDIPVASGLGSGAAVSVAVARALSEHFGRPLPNEAVSDLAFEVERIHHGTPSGIDNTVVAFERPVYFEKGAAPVPFVMRGSLHLILGDTGIPSPTSIAVAQVRRRWEQDKLATERLFDRIGTVARDARRLLERGEFAALGPLMDRNHALLGELGVSVPALEKLVAAARNAGAWGAKLSGAGLGGNMVAVAPPDRVVAVQQALSAAGAVRTLVSQVRS